MCRDRIRSPMFQVGKGRDNLAADVSPLPSRTLTSNVGSY